MGVYWQSWPSTKKCLLLLCRVRRSSTWSSPLLPTLHYMRHGAPRPIRVKCSLGTKWRNVTSVSFPREPPCSSLQVCSWPLMFHSDSRTFSGPCTLNAALIMTQCSDAFKIQAASSRSLEIQRGSLKEHLWKCCWHLRRSLVMWLPSPPRFRHTASLIIVAVVTNTFHMHWEAEVFILTVAPARKTQNLVKLLTANGK